jgi:hypothetical protein
VAERDPELRKKLLKSVRLWVLSLICASVGSVTIWATDSIGLGVLAFLGSLVVLGAMLWLYEKVSPDRMQRGNRGPSPLTVIRLDVGARAGVTGAVCGLPGVVSQG